MREVELSIEGMTCAACAARVEKKLNKLQDVAAAVNYATATARVIAPAGLPVRELTAAVEQAGYAASEPTTARAGEGTEAADGRDAAYLKRRLIVALVFFIPLTDLSLMLSLVPSLRFDGWQWLLVACAAPVALWCAWPFHRAALKNARHGTSSMDTLVSLGIIAACGWSVYAMFVLDPAEHGGSFWQLLIHASGGGIYLETAATVTTFLLAAGCTRHAGPAHHGQAMRELAAAGASDVCLLDPDGTERLVTAGSLRPGDTFVVRPGEIIAADGEVLFGRTAVDHAAMTGESVPGEAAEGDSVIGGTVALTGRLVVRAVKTGQDTQLSHLIRLVERAQAQKAAIQPMADRISAVFVPAVLACAGVTLAGWLLAGSPAGHAVSAGLAVSIVACPCALGLATPAALVAACGRGARLGIFIKGYQVLESSRSLQVVVLDKTGTVTTGQMSLVGVRPDTGVSRADLLRLAGAVEQASEHAVAAAISAAAKDKAGPLPQAAEFKALPGLGARGVVDGREVVVGREKLFAERGLTVPPGLTQQCRSWELAGHTAVLIGWDGLARGAVAVADTVKTVVSCRGRRAARARAAPDPADRGHRGHRPGRAAAVGVDEVIAGTLPAEKAAVITGLQARGRRVAMVGDGINDAPALAAADLGLALGSGTDVAICAADLILLRDDLGTVADAIRLSRATFRTIRQNLAWAFGYNVAAIPLAALGFLNPVVASAAMTLSSVFVVSNSLRLQQFDQRRRMGNGKAGRGRAVPAPAHAVPGPTTVNTIASTTGVAGRRGYLGGRRVRVQPRQGQLSAAAAPDRRTGARSTADDRRGQVLHRHPHPGSRRHQGSAIGCPRPAGRAPQPLRRAGHGRGRRRRGG